MGSLAGTLLRRLTPHNPLYIISAGLFLRGLRIIYNEEFGKTAPWTLLAMLAGYTLLVCALGVWVIRKIHVWDDARTILLVVAVLLMSGSMLFDETVVQNPRVGTIMLAASWLFAAAVSETIVRASRMPLPIQCRLTWLGLLGVFHLWPALLSQVLYRRDSQIANALSAAFPLVAALALAPVLWNLRSWSTLKPPDDSGWSFPLFPLALFIMATVGAGLRAPLLALSFGQGAGADSIFDIWMLLPLLAVVALAVVELACLFADDTRWAAAALLFPLALVVVPWIQLNAAPSGAAFQRGFADRFGEPHVWGLAFATLVLLAAARRRLAFAEAASGLAGALFLVACFAPLGHRLPVGANEWPLGVATLAVVAAAIRSAQSTTVFAAAVMVIFTGSTAFKSQLPSMPWFGPPPFVWLALAAGVLVTFNDRRRNIVGWIVGALSIWTGSLHEPPTPLVVAFGVHGALVIWMAALIGMGELLSRLTGTKGPRCGAVGNLLIGLGYGAYLLTETAARISTGTRWILAGLFALILAAIASYVKRPQRDYKPSTMIAR